jgi:hypothetical protein
MPVPGDRSSIWRKGWRIRLKCESRDSHLRYFNPLDPYIHATRVCPDSFARRGWQVATDSQTALVRHYASDHEFA